MTRKQKLVKVTKILRPGSWLDEPPGDNRPACCAVLSEIVRQHWNGRERPGNPAGTDTCGRKSSLRIGDKTYCALHGGMVLIRLAVKAGGIATETR
jgi:hypothetical protein